MRAVYLAIAALIVGAMALSGEWPSGDSQQVSLFATLVGGGSQATPDTLQVGDPINPGLLTSSR